MFDHELLMRGLGLAVVAAPLVLLLVLGVASLVGHPLPERRIGRLGHLAIAIGFVASVTILGLMLLSGTYCVPIEMGSWVAIPHYHFSVKFVFDRLSVP